MNEIVITEDHIKLVRRMYVDWDDDHFSTGAPYVGQKRPLWEFVGSR